jgi:hypothetical protein
VRDERLVQKLTTHDIQDVSVLFSLADKCARAAEGCAWHSSTAPAVKEESKPNAGVHVVWSVARKLCETSDILTHNHGSLLQILEFLLLELDYTLGHMMRPESHLELILADGVGFFMSFYICIPPIRCRAYKLVRSYQDLLPVVALHNLKLLLYSLGPIIGVHRFHGM